MASEKQNTMRSHPIEPPTTGAIREIRNGEAAKRFECEMAGDAMNAPCVISPHRIKAASAEGRRDRVPILHFSVDRDLARNSCLEC